MEHRTGLVGLDGDLVRERAVMADRCPPYERALAMLPSVLAGKVGRYVAAAWEQRTFFAWYDRPLLLLAALRADARAEGPSHPLHAAFASEPPRPEAVTPQALEEALDGTRERIFDHLAHRHVSTNETSRAIAWLWPAALAGAGRRAITLADVGASAGLNLVADALPSVWTADDGAPLPLARNVKAAARLGLDAAPLDATQEADAEWLRACIWPGDPERAERLEAALAAFRAARTRRDAPVLIPVTATSVPARLDTLSAAEPTTLVIAYQTIMRDYLPPDDLAAYESGMRDWLGARAPGSALWVMLEAGPEGRTSDVPAVLQAQIRAPSGELQLFELARCGFHPRQLRVDRSAEAGLAALLGGAAAVTLAHP